MPKYRVEDFEPILKQVSNICSHTRIENFLRDAKKINPDIKSSGKKDQIVFESLKEAAKEESLADAIIDMLVDAEESGRQYVFLYRANTPDVAAAASDAEAVAEGVLGVGWQERLEFPKVLARPEGEVWADFRIGPTGSLGSGWVAKRYLGKKRWEPSERKPVSAGLEVQMWRQRLRREVLLVRWRPEGILEMRIPQRPTRNELYAEVAGLWTAIGGGLKEGDFEPLNLTPACMRLIEEHESYVDLCRLGDARVRDEQMGFAKFSTPSGRDHLMSNITREKAIRLYRLCSELVVTWHLDRDSHDASGDLRTVVGKHGAHTIHVRARTTGRAVQHATDQFLRLLRQDPAGAPGA
ncbi:hypothetical protein [Paludisphaera mucosa]|uniref:Uncharacterized protein n=1 Tax=Paludisphaera mucosa TaxID=3030827 RepID=A0ABT6FIX4_9BACT|nr:hypothetical protein [Paludisphaera mucosa]MDG3007345.1 hypothetical protein [Paludisphaera mucosa]